jgi:hypothetical protein
MLKLALAAMAAVVGLASAGASAADLEGRLLRRNVFTKNAEAAPHVAVTLSARTLGRSVISYTNSAGAYKFRNLAAGSYLLEIWLTGNSGELNSDQMVACSFNLVPGAQRTELPPLSLRNSGFRAGRGARPCSQGLDHWFQ